MVAWTVQFPAHSTMFSKATIALDHRQCNHFTRMASTINSASLLKVRGCRKSGRSGTLLELLSATNRKFLSVLTVRLSIMAVPVRTIAR
jgi:hypothetical protein